MWFLADCMKLFVAENGWKMDKMRRYLRFKAFEHCFEKILNKNSSWITPRTEKSRVFYHENGCILWYYWKLCIKSSLKSKIFHVKSTFHSTNVEIRCIIQNHGTIMSYDEGWAYNLSLNLEVAVIEVFLGPWTAVAFASLSRHPLHQKLAAFDEIYVCRLDGLVSGHDVSLQNNHDLHLYWMSNNAQLLGHQLNNRNRSSACVISVNHILHKFDQFSPAL